MNTLQKKYLADTRNNSDLKSGQSGHVEWNCPSNIALIKYWGKKPFQQPINPSVSFSLMHSTTVMTVDYEVKEKEDGLVLEFLVEDQPNVLFAERVLNYLNHVSKYLPFLNRMHLKVKSVNSFPHSAGIASSASSFGALALALCNIEQLLFGTTADEHDFLRKSSFLARLGSGSASRSVYGGYALWGHLADVDGSSDETAVSISGIVHPVFLNYRDSILVVKSGSKAISSSDGHRLMEHHPFAGARIIQANKNIEILLRALSVGDTYLFTEVLENEALTLHGLMLSSNPGYILMQPGTIEILNKILIFRKETGNPVGFTLDAGANVHLLYPAAIETEVRIFIENELKKHCENGWIIHDEVGSGPKETKAQ